MSVVRPSGQPSDGVQGQSGPWISLSVIEIRRLLWRLVLAVPQTIRDILAWPQWRRWHQTVANYYHYKRHEAVADAVAE